MENSNEEIKSLLKEYKYSRLFRNYSVKYSEEIGHIYFASINDNNDVEESKQHVENIIRYYSEIYPLVNDDIEQIQLEIGKYEVTLQKVVQCYDNPNCNFNYTTEQIIDLIDNLEKYEKKLSDIYLRKACQD